MAQESMQNRPELSEVAKDFLKEEQKQRRQEIENLIARIENDMKIGLIGTGVIWSWLVANSDKLRPPMNVIAVSLPVIIIAFFFLRWSTINTSIAAVADYTKNLEDLFEVPQGVGWEGWLTALRESPRSPWGWIDSAKVLWIGLLVVNIILSFLFIKLGGR
jgi:hypothetical protein